MGFCLLENPDMPNGWYAINPTHVVDVEEVLSETHRGPVCKLVFPKSIDVAGFDYLVKGTLQDIENTFFEASKIGSGTVSITILGGRDSKRTMSMQMGNTNRIVLIRELLPEEFIDEDGNILTCSLMVFEDNTTRFVIERPGVLARNINAGNRVPKFPK